MPLFVTVSSQFLTNLALLSRVFAASTNFNGSLAIGWSLFLLVQRERLQQHPRFAIDNNPVENSIRPEPAPVQFSD